MRKLTLFAMAALLLVCTQCKKNDATESAKTIHITFSPTDNEAKTGFNPDGSFSWSNDEYIFVGANNSTDCIGVLHSTNNGASFDGDITVPTGCNMLHFFYLGNDKEGEYPTTLDFSTQNDQQNLTNLHVACISLAYDESVTSYSGSLKTLVSFAYLDLSAFQDANDKQEVVYLHGADIFSAATVNYSEGSITGTKGYINLGKAIDGGGYYALIPQTTPTNTVVKFDSNSKTGTMNFLRGIEAGKLYKAQESALAPTMGELRENAGGLFSVSDTKMVRLAKSNLQYTRTSTTENWENGTWSFMTEPWDQAEINGTIGEEYNDQTAISLFGWGTSGADLGFYGLYYYPWATAEQEDEYGPLNPNLSLTFEDGFANGDWGINNNASLGGGEPSWRVLTSDEWLYLFGMTENNQNQDIEGHKRYQKYGRARINLSPNQKGIIIVPDDFNDPKVNRNSAHREFVGGTQTFWGSNVNEGSNYIKDIEDWNKLANAGAIFLPLEGLRQGTTVSQCGTWAYYQSSTVKNATYSHQLFFKSDEIKPCNSSRRYTGMSVRLVMDLD